MEPQSRLGGSLAVQFDHVIPDEAEREARLGKQCIREARPKNANKEARVEVEDLVILSVVQVKMMKCRKFLSLDGGE